MMEWLMDKPIPIPWDLVVKNASKIRFSFFGIDADAGVSHRYQQFIRALHLGTDHQTPRPIGNIAHRLDAIQDQIHDHLLQLDPVAHRGWEIGGQLGLESHLVSRPRPLRSERRLRESGR